VNSQWSQSTGRVTQHSDEATGWTTGVRFPGRAGFLFAVASRPALGPTKPSIQWVSGGSLPGGKTAGAWSWPLTSTWSYTSTPAYVFMAWCLVRHRDNFVYCYLTETNWQPICYDMTHREKWARGEREGQHTHTHTRARALLNTWAKLAIFFIVWSRS
jgi:hypothetical protein